MNQFYQTSFLHLRCKGFFMSFGRALFFLAVIAFAIQDVKAQQMEASTDTLRVVLSPGSSATTFFTLTNNRDVAVIVQGYDQLDVYSTGKPVSFTKANNTSWQLPSNQDRIADHVWLTRDLTKSIFNAKSEVVSTNTSPQHTKWALGTINEIVASAFTTFNAMHGNDPQALVGDTATLKIDFENGAYSEYYSIYMKSWTGGNGGGGFSYVRKQMVPFYELNTPYVGEILSRASKDVQLNINADRLESGFHYGRIVINSDDLDNPAITVVVEVKVLPEPEIVVSRSSIHAVVDNNTGALVETFSITNNGGSVLNWYGNTEGNTESMCATFSALSGAIAPGATVEYSVTFDVCNEGSYDWPFVIYSNDPDNEEALLELSTVVDGNPHIAYDAPFFADTYVGASSTGSLIIYSTGTADLNITDISSDNVTFSPTKKVLTVQAGQSATIPVKFLPKSSGTISGHLTIESNDEATGTVSVPVSAVGVAAPVIKVSPLSLSFSLAHGEHKKDSIAISNNGNSDLSWTYSASGAFKSVEGIYFKKENNVDITLPENQDRLTQNAILVRDTDGGLYNYAETEIRFALGSATELNASDYISSFRDAVDSDARELPGQILSVYIPAENRFFDLHMESWTCCGNGGGFAYKRYEVYKWLSAVYKEGPEVTFSKGDWADNSLVENRDQVTDNISLVKDNSWNGRLFDYHGNEIRLALKPAKDVKKDDYQVYGYLPSEVVGRTISIYIPGDERFFDLDILSSSMNGGGISYVRREVFPVRTNEAQSTSYAVVEAAATVPAGSYMGSIIVESNDPIAPKITVPVTITATGTPDISETPTAFDFGTTIAGVSKIFYVTLKNNGSDVLNVNALTVDNPAFDVAPDPFTVNAGGLHKLQITVVSYEVGDISTELTVTSNDPDNPSYSLNISGEVLDAPQFVLPDLVFYDTLDFGTTNVQPLTILNEGPGILEWEVAYDTYFEKKNYVPFIDPAAQDRITDNVWLTRGDIRGLFNILEADQYEEQPGTFEWGNASTTYLSSYYSYFEDDWDGADLMNGASTSIHLIPDNKYYDFKFTSWTSGEGEGGGGFAYMRREAARWLGFDVLSGTIGPDGSVEIPVNFSALTTNAGDYELSYTLSTNDPANPQKKVTFMLHVDGEPEIDLVTDPLNFGSHPVGGIHEMAPFTISNTGGADLELTLSSDNAAFNFENTSIIIPGGGSREVVTLFSPLAVQNYTGNINILSNDVDEGTITIAIAGDGYEGPDLALNTTQLAATLLSGGQVTKSVTLSNTGGTSLSYRFAKGFFEKDNHADWTLAENQFRISDRVWLTRANNGALFNILEGNQWTSNAQTIKWALGASKDLEPSDYSSDWRHVRNSLPGGRFSNLPGQIVSLYLVEEDRYVDLYFTKWTTSNNGGGVAFYHVESGVVSPESGDLTAGASQEVQITFDATGLDAGTYLEEYMIFHNGVKKTDTISTQLTIVGIPELSITNAVTFGVSPIGDESQGEIIVSNTGSASATVIMASTNAAFIVGDETIRVKAGETKVLEVIFKPFSAEVFTGTITLTTSDPGKPTFGVAVTGSGATAATIAVTSPVLETSLFFGESVTKSVTISNSGEFNLNWSLGISGEVVFFEKEDYADQTLAANQDHISEYLRITRQIRRGIYNTFLEDRYNDDEDDSPLGTEWAAVPSADVASISDYDYWENATDDVGGAIDQPGHTFSMHDIQADHFYDIEWLSWTSNGDGGGFSYNRKPVFGIEYRGISFSDTDGVIAPGQSATLLITYNPNSDFAGDFELPLTIISNDPVNEEIKIPLSLSVRGIIVDRFIDDQLMNEGFSSKSIDLTGVFVDAQGDELEYEVSSSNGAVVTAFIRNGSVVLSEIGYGTSLITVTATDATGNSASEKFNFRVNGVPDVNPIEDKFYDRLFGSVTLDVAPFFSDPEGEELAFTIANSADAVVTASLSGSVITFTEQGAGSSLVTVTATDLSGGSFADTFNFSIDLLDQTITFDTVYVKKYGDDLFELVASSSSGLPVSFFSSDETIISVERTTCTIKGAGNVIITARQKGDDIYAPAGEVPNVISVAKTTLTVTAEDTTITYGSAQPEYILSYSGFVGNDGPSDIDTAPEGIVTASEINGAGNYILQITQNANDDNYSFEYVDGTLTVTKAKLIITAEDHSRVYGEPNPVLTVNYSGFVNGENESMLTTLPITTTIADELSNAGTYAISVSGAESGNYQFTYVGGILTVEKATAKIIISDLEQEADGGEKKPRIVTDPVGLNYTVTFNGAFGAPKAAGGYEVVVDIDEANYEGSASATFVLTEVALGLADKFELTVYPNPGENYLIVRSAVREHVLIYNLEGKIQMTARTNETLDITQLHSGTYLIAVGEKIIKFIKR